MVSVVLKTVAASPLFEKVVTLTDVVNCVEVVSQMEVGLPRADAWGSSATLLPNPFRPSDVGQRVITKHTMASLGLNTELID